MTIVAIRANGCTISTQDVRDRAEAKAWLEQKQLEWRGYAPIQVAYTSDGSSLEPMEVPPPPIARG